MDRISIHLPFLGKVRGRLSVENVVDMLENARRRIVDQRRYDDGVARLYRTIEMWHQWRLQKHNRSILAHGLEPIGKDAALRFLGYVDGMVETPEVRSTAEHAALRGL